MKKWLAVPSLVVVTASIAGCAGTGDPAASTPGATVTVTASPSPTEPPSPAPTPIGELAAADIAQLFETQMKGIPQVTVIDENNDANNLIGRPGGYVSAAVVSDQAGDMTDSEPGVAWGATVEVFASQADAQRRKDYIQTILQSTPMFGTEYSYVSDRALLRVSGDLKPSRAARYEEVFMSIPVG